MSGQGRARTVLVVAGIAAALGAGFVLGAIVTGDGAELRAAQRDVERLAARAELAERALELAREEARRPRRRPEEPASSGGEPVAVSAADEARAAAIDAPAQPDSAAPGPEERRRRVDELRAQVPVWFDRADGPALLGALKELAALVPEGRAAAMELALQINDDVNRDGVLRLSDVTFYTALGDPAVRDLMNWALERPETVSGFRVMAAYSLPWTQGADETLERFERALAAEPELDVQRALAANLARLKDPRADALLGAILSDSESAPGLRAQVASALMDVQDGDLLRALERAATDDPDPDVRAAATASLVARNPPATGYLVTGTLPDGQASAAGLRPGDIVVSYNGAETLTIEALRRATADAAGADEVAVQVRRGDEEVTVLVRPGRLGVFGRSVEAAQR